MSTPIITVESLGKKYTLSHQGDRAGYKTLRDTVIAKAKRLFRPWNRDSRPDSGGRQEEFWALKDLSFEVRQGEVLGVIGRNGAGKSTLLKVLSRITEPTTGRIRLRGRVACLLEVGTGFHPELTGRENVFLNGAILGMRHQEILSKFDEIVAFSEIEQFLDTPVKRYSSGMYVKLAFAVAAHLEPEILIVDEVLAVGDSAFQKKCIGKISDVARDGRTILFVSHNLSVVRSLCSRGIVLTSGELTMDASADEAISYYLRHLEVQSRQDIESRTDRRGDGRIRFTALSIVGDAGAPTVFLGRPAEFQFRFRGSCRDTQCAFTIYDSLGSAVSHFNTAVSSSLDHRARATAGGGSDAHEGHQATCTIGAVPLVPGRYYLSAALHGDGILQDHLTAMAYFEVEPDLYGDGLRAQSSGYGSVCIDHRWTMDRDDLQAGGPVPDRVRTHSIYV